MEWTAMYGPAIAVEALFHYLTGSEDGHANANRK
jgi:hypothetical protein